MVLLMALCVISESHAQELRLPSEQLAQIQSRFRHVKIAVWSEKPRYVQGENVVLKYKFSSDRSHEFSIAQYEVSNAIELICNGDTIPHMRVLTTMEPWQFPKSTIFEGALTVEDWGLEQSRQECGFNYLMPGHYVGYISLDVPSQFFHFDIDPLLDSLRATWNDLCSLGNALHRSKELNKLGVVRDILPRMLAAPRSNPLREHALLLAGRLLGYNREYWQDSDSLLCHSVVSELARGTSSISQSSALITALSAFFKGHPKNDDRFYQNLRVFADTINSPAFSDYVEDWVSKQIANRRVDK